MDKIRNFLRDKAFLMVILACVAAAVLVGVWAVGTVRSNLRQNLEQDGTSGADVAGLEEYPGLAGDAGLEEENEWDTGLDVAGKAENVPENNVQNGQQGSSASSSGSASSGQSAAGQKKSGEPAAAAAPSYTQPVSGSVIQAYSGDELVYSKTLEDWRTHNGIDYACGTGDNVYAPVGGTVSAAATDGNWGGIVEITDEGGRVWRLCGVTAAVAKGDAVVIGQQVGTSSVIGCENAEGSHIHVEVKKDDQYVDPATLMG